jgi:hypothetical protein
VLGQANVCNNFEVVSVPTSQGKQTLFAVRLSEDDLQEPGCQGGNVTFRHHGLANLEDRYLCLKVEMVLLLPPLSKRLLNG